MMSTFSKNPVDVLVVGAGPVGLMLASEVVRHGLSCRIIDEKTGPSETSRALGVFNRTLEVMEKAGLAERLQQQGQAARFMNVYADGKHILQTAFDASSFDTPYTSPIFCSQVRVEATLREHLADMGIQVEWGVELLSFVQDATGVSATLKHTEHEEQLRSRWLVGCDGAHSRVRKQLDLPFPGTPDETWLVVDVDLDWSLPKDSLYAFLSPEGTIVAFPFPEGKRWRLLETVVDEKTDKMSVAQRFTRKLNAVYRDERVIVPEPDWISVFTIQQRHVPNMRAGRCFVVGDAAHIHSPASGQGMNTGIQDAFNLAWKLALVTKDQAHDSLLDSYSAEREPIAEVVLKGAKIFTRVIGRQRPLVQKTRNVVLRSVAVLPLLRRSLNRRITSMLSGLGLAYSASPIIAEDWSEVTTAKKVWDGFAPGVRVPDIHFGVKETEHLFALFEGTRHVALVFAGQKATPDELSRLEQVVEGMQRQYQEWLNTYLVVPSSEALSQLRMADAVIVDQQGVLHQRFAVQAGALYLVRPDGYVGYRNRPVQEECFEHYVKDTLHMQVAVYR